MKLSQDIEKVTIPGKKNAFRLYGGDGKSYVPITFFFNYFFSNWKYALPREPLEK